MKRIFDLSYKDYFKLSKNELIETIKISEGRTVMAETVISTNSLLDGISNPETAAAFSADMITLNTFDFNNPFIFGYDDNNISFTKGISQYVDSLKEISILNSKNDNYIKEFKKILGRFIGVNLEPVNDSIEYPEGLKLNEKNLEKFKILGFDYLVITANPNTQVTSGDIVKGIKLARNILGEDTLIIAGKMHGAGSGNIYDINTISSFIKAGADIILTPAPGTVLGMTLDKTSEIIRTIHENNALALTTIGTSQEGGEESFIEKTAILSKMAGSDIMHTGDAGISGMTPPENILALSKTIRGKRHTYRVMSRSSHR